MLFTNALTYAAAFTVALPTISALYPWNERTHLYNIGEVPTQNRKVSRATKWMGRCGGDDIAVGSYGCGNFGYKGNAIYKCVEDPDKYEGAWLKLSEVCLWKDFGGGYGGQCVRNQRKKGKKFYPLVDGKKGVCITTEQL